MARLAVLADDLAGALQLARQALVGADDLVEGVGDLAGEPGLIARQADREIAVAYGLQRAQQLAQVQVGAFAAIGSVRLGQAPGTYLHLHQQTPEKLRYPAGVSDRQANSSDGAISSAVRARQRRANRKWGTGSPGGVRRPLDHPAGASGAAAGRQGPHHGDSPAPPDRAGLRATCKTPRPVSLSDQINVGEHIRSLSWRKSIPAPQ